MQRLLRGGLGGAIGLRNGIRRRRGQQLGAELQTRRRPVAHLARIALRQPERHMEQLAQRVQRVLLRHRAGVVHGLIAQAADYVHLGVHRAAHQLLKAGLEQKGRQIRLVRHAQAAAPAPFGLEQPRHGQLQRAAGVEAGGARVGQGCGFGAAGFGQQVGPVGLQECEVRRCAQGTPSGAETVLKIF